MIMSMDYVAWANKNKKRIAREFIRRIDYEPSATPAAIFTAGLPGAGKTEFTVELLKGLSKKPLRMDMDEIAQLIEGYKPEIADKFRGGASSILSRIYDEVVKNNIDFVFDGTFAHANAILNLERALKHGYTVKVYYIHQEPAVAWQFTKDRELVVHRAIDRIGFNETYLNLEENLKTLCNIHKDVTISLVIKDENNQVGRIVENVQNLFDQLPPFLSKTKLESDIL
jgi:UDP-N-acetylglucosamine kinase